MGVGERIRTILQGLDARMADASLQSFRASAPSIAPRQNVFAASLDRVREHVSPQGRMRVVIHWSIDDARPQDLSLLRPLVDAGHHIVTVNWDGMDSSAPVATTRARVERAMSERLCTAVYTGTSAGLFETLRITSRSTPQTRVLDADGGILRTFEGPVEDHDIRVLVALLNE